MSLWISLFAKLSLSEVVALMLDDRDAANAGWQRCSLCRENGTCLPGALLPLAVSCAKPLCPSPLGPRAQNSALHSLTRGHWAARLQGRGAVQVLSTGQVAPETWSKTREICVGDVSWHFGFCLIHYAITSHTSDALNWQFPTCEQSLGTVSV